MSILNSVDEEFAAALKYCINHDAWENAEKGLRDETEGTEATIHSNPYTKYWMPCII